MKKIISILLLFILCTSHVFAATYQKEADALNQLGLFRGTDNGYQLEKTFTRAEGAAMLVRLLGKEQEALQKVYTSCAFEDVQEHWAKQYVLYCFEHGITKGTGGNTYSPDNNMSGEEFVSLVLRSLGYTNVNPDNADIAASEFSLAESKKVKEIFTGDFVRDKMVFVAYRALLVKDTSGVALIDSLAEKGAVSKETAKRLGIIVMDKKHIEVNR